jgi:hypothetical protein
MYRPERCGGAQKSCPSEIPHAWRKFGCQRSNILGTSAQGSESRQDVPHSLSHFNNIGLSRLQLRYQLIPNPIKSVHVKEEYPLPFFDV